MSFYLLLSFNDQHRGRIGIGHVGLLKNPNLGTYSGYTLTGKLDELISRRTGVITSWPKNDSVEYSLEATVKETSEYRGANILGYSARVKDLETKRDGLVASFLLTERQTTKTRASVQVTKPTKVTEISKAISSISRISDSQVSANLTDESSDVDFSSGFISSAEGDDSTPANSDGSESSPEKNPLFTSTPDTSLTTMSVVLNSSGSKRQKLDNSLNPQPKKRSKREEAKELQEKLDRLQREKEEEERKRTEEAAELTNRLNTLNEDTSDSSVSRIFFQAEQSEQLNQALSQLQTCNERIESLETQVHTLEEENKSLREENAAIKASTPEALSKELVNGLNILKGLIATPGFSSRPNNQANSAGDMVKLSAKCQQLIKSTDLKDAMSHGITGPGIKPLGKMVRAIMVAIWNREYMATHSIGGQKSPTDPDKTTPPKPKIDEDAFQAIRMFANKFWSDKHKAPLDPSWIRTAVEDKLMYEHREYKKQQAATAAKAAAAATANGGEAADP